jgi:predicted RNA-binding protein
MIFYIYLSLVLKINTVFSLRYKIRPVVVFSVEYEVKLKMQLAKFISRLL